ncbi:DUF2513 domain-containing protein [Legionella sp. CNM-1927-20]|uniref:DUF2513 domain-containing protein n=1 Tax=Legionella sp. CNM-1927-20 TaxID=3422221 RepID=UPI00403B2049
MKRNWDMIRSILLKVEELEPNALLNLDVFPVDKHHEISYHLEILEEAGVLIGKIHKTPGGSPHGFHLIRLTWRGHDLLESIRLEPRWVEIKKQLHDKNIELNLENILFIAQALTRKSLK